MDGGAAAAAYAAESAVEGAVAAGVAVAQPSLPLRARWHRIPLDDDGRPAARSSHSLCIVRGRAYVWGGETGPRRYAGNDMHVVTLPAAAGAPAADYRVVPAPVPDYPPPRVGHVAVALGTRIYMFGGLGGTDDGLLAEKGRVWTFDTLTNAWSHLDPAPNSPVPDGRCYAAATASEHPRPAPQGAGADAVAAAETLDAFGTLIVHGGFTAGGAQADVWAFDAAARVWARLPDAPAPARGGAGLALARDRLYRFGGYGDGKELGGGVDYLELAKQTFDDAAGKAEMALASKTGAWKTVAPAEGAAGPGPRSVPGLHAITTGQGRQYLACLLGEREPAADHLHAGKFWPDVWAYQLRPEGMTAASFKDAARMLVGAKQTEGTWAPVDVPEASKAEGPLETPGARGWFASAAAGDVAPGAIVVWGGLNEANERLGDGWMLTFGDE